MLNKSQWRGLIKVTEISKISAGQVIWKEINLLNMLHFEGEEYVLRALFDGEVISESYYFGLDSRSTITEDQNMQSIVQAGEPCSNGYERQAVNSNGQFDIFQSDENIWIAKTPVIQFSAIGGEWGYVKNLFMTNKLDNSGYLIASVKLTSQVRILSGETIYVKMGLMLRNDDTLSFC